MLTGWKTDAASNSRHPWTRKSEIIWIRSFAFASSVCRVTVVLSPLNLRATAPQILTSKKTRSNAHRHSRGFLRCFFLDPATKCYWGKIKINTVLMTLPEVCWSWITVRNWILKLIKTSPLFFFYKGFMISVGNISNPLMMMWNLHIRPPYSTFFPPSGRELKCKHSKPLNPQCTKPMP